MAVAILQQLNIPVNGLAHKLTGIDGERSDQEGREVIHEQESSGVGLVEGLYYNR
jgi:hypothetical protein